MICLYDGRSGSFLNRSIVEPFSISMAMKGVLLRSPTSKIVATLSWCMAAIERASLMKRARLFGVDAIFRFITFSATVRFKRVSSARKT